MSIKRFIHKMTRGRHDQYLILRLEIIDLKKMKMNAPCLGKFGNKFLISTNCGIKY